MAENGTTSFIGKINHAASRYYVFNDYYSMESDKTVVLLSKGEVDSKKIRVEFSLEDMDMSEFQDGATYTQIKDYVLERSGLKDPIFISHKLSGNVGLRLPIICISGQNWTI